MQSSQGIWSGLSATTLCPMLFAACLTIPVILFGCVNAAAAELNITLVGSTFACANDDAVLQVLRTNLKKDGLLNCEVQAGDRDEFTPRVAGLLQSSSAIIVFGNKFAPSLECVKLVRQFAASGGGVVLVGGGDNFETTWSELVQKVSGARNTGSFAKGEPASVISIYPHAIFSSVQEFEYGKGLGQYIVNPDVQVVMEGIVGENTTPMAWLLNNAEARSFTLSVGEDASLASAAFLRIISNAVRWAARVPIPRAGALVQRAYLPTAHPGSFAITFPLGPTVCFDPVRGGINYLTDGDFVDLRPAWTAKHGAAQREYAGRVMGKYFYREDMSAAVHEYASDVNSPYQFKGFKMENGAPVFYYICGDRKIAEKITSLPDHDGIVRKIAVGAGKGALFFRVGLESGSQISVTGALLEGNFVKFVEPQAGECNITIRRAAQ